MLIVFLKKKIHLCTKLLPSNGKLSKLSEKHMHLPATCIIYHKSSTSADYSHHAHLKCLATCFENELVTKSPGVCWHCCCHRSKALKSKGASNPSARQPIRLEEEHFQLEEAGIATQYSWASQAERPPTLTMFNHETSLHLQEFIKMLTNSY